MKKSILFSALVALLVSSGTIGIYKVMDKEEAVLKVEHTSSVPSSNVLYSLDENGEPVALDFSETAADVVDAVVHITSTQTYSSNRQDPRGEMQVPEAFRDFFGPDFFGGPRGGQRGPQTRVGTGSGVIINQSGYIVTNNHVIADASDIEVSLYDNRVFKAEVIGTDPSTDLALLKVDEENLPSLAFVDSEEVRVGQWVMAVGNPFSLNSTVTAGIVSAIGRSINILDDKYAVEDFIQTDAAINPGNSGGALVNLAGGLVGINTAIASPTGAYSGYGFAVPSNIVAKVVADLMKYGEVQRGLLGIAIQNVEGNFASEMNLDINQGVYIQNVNPGSAAEEAGVTQGDVITKVDDLAINTVADLQGAIAQRRPGETVQLTINREGKIIERQVTLKNKNNSLEIVEKSSSDIQNLLGAEMKTIDEALADKLNLQGGVQVVQLNAGKLRRETQLNEGFVITKVNGDQIESIEDLTEKLEGSEGGVMLEGVYEDIPGTHYYAFGM